MPADIPDPHPFVRRLAADGRLHELIAREVDRQSRTRALQIGLNEFKLGDKVLETLRAGRQAIEKLAQDPQASLTPQERIGMAAVIRITSRPALLIQNDWLAEDPPERWRTLQTYYCRDLRERLPKVGRISLGQGTAARGLGTGFVVAPGIIVTNRHVLEVFGEPDRGGKAVEGDEDGSWEAWRLVGGSEPFIDFKMEFDNPATLAFRITGVVGAASRAMHPSRDIAFLSVDAESVRPPRDGSGSLPAPVQLSADPPPFAEHSELYVIGYPQVDNESLPEDAQARTELAAVMTELFGDAYGLKRLSPGEALAFDDASWTFSHDCSTLGGSSGSCVIDLRSNQVIGLHFQGQRMHGNRAVAWWKYREDPFIKNRVKASFD